MPDARWMGRSEEVIDPMRALGADESRPSMASWPAHRGLLAQKGTRSIAARADLDVIAARHPVGRYVEYQRPGLTVTSRRARYIGWGKRQD